MRYYKLYKKLHNKKWRLVTTSWNTEENRDMGKKKLEETALRIREKAKKMEKWVPPIKITEVNEVEVWRFG